MLITFGHLDFKTKFSSVCWYCQQFLVGMRPQLKYTIPQLTAGHQQEAQCLPEPEHHWSLWEKEFLLSEAILIHHLFLLLPLLRNMMSIWALGLWQNQHSSQGENILVQFQFQLFSLITCPKDAGGFKNLSFRIKQNITCTCLF